MTERVIFSTSLFRSNPEAARRLNDVADVLAECGWSRELINIMRTEELIHRTTDVSGAEGRFFIVEDSETHEVIKVAYESETLDPARVFEIALAPSHKTGQPLNDWDAATAERALRDLQEEILKSA